MTDLDETFGTPCIVCGAPILKNEGHDEGCALESDMDKMDRAMAYDPSTQRGEDGEWGDGFARNN